MGGAHDGLDAVLLGEDVGDVLVEVQCPADGAE